MHGKLVEGLFFWVGEGFGDDLLRSAQTSYMVSFCQSKVNP
jgi:hypothetical protein